MVKFKFRISSLSKKKKKENWKMAKFFRETKENIIWKYPWIFWVEDLLKNVNLNLNLNFQR